MPLRLDIKKKLSTRSDRVKSVDIHPTEPWILASLYDGNVYIWNYETQNMVKSFEVSPQNPVRTAKFIPKKQWIVTGSDDTYIRVYNYNTMEKIKSFEAHADYIRCIIVHPTLPYILSSSDDMFIKLWDYEKWTNIQVFEGHSHYVMSMAWNPKDTNVFATASLDKTVKVWSINSPHPHFTLEGHEKGVNAVEYFSGGEKPYLISGADDKLVKIWDYQSKTCVQTLEGHSNNVSAVCYHPELPLILSGSEDGTIKLWHSSTYRLERTLNYGMGFVWSMNFLRGSNFIGVGYDDGTVVLKIGKNKPPVSMDQGGKVIYAKHNEIRIANISNTLESDTVQDGEKLLISSKDLGNCEVFPQKLQHNSNGRFVSVCGDGEFIIYTALAWRNKSFGNALEFVWAEDSGQYAVRESSSRIKIFKNFKETHSFKPAFSAEGIFGGSLLGVKSNDTLCFYSWDSADIIRRIEKTSPKNIFWSENGDYLAIVTDKSTFILRYFKDTVQKYMESGQPIGELGIEDAFDVVHEIEDTIGSALWVGDCFIYVNKNSKLNYCVGTEVVTISHLEKHMYLLKYLPQSGRLYLSDKNLNIVSYKLHLSVISYQTSILRGDLESAERILPKIPQDQRNSIAHFLESQGYKEKALEVSTDLDHRFELAIQLENLQIAHEIALKSESETKFKHLGDLALQIGDIKLAENCLKKAEDLPGLLLLYSSVGNLEGMKELSILAEEKGQTNISFICNLLIPNSLLNCLNTLCEGGGFSEAAFMARTYLPSLIPEMVEKWKENLKHTSSKAAEALSNPIDYPNLFPGYDLSVRAEKYFESLRSHPKSAKEYVNIPKKQRNLIEEVENVSEQEYEKVLSSLQDFSLHGSKHTKSPIVTSNTNGLDSPSLVNIETTTTATNTNNNNNNTAASLLDDLDFTTSTTSNNNTPVKSPSPQLNNNLFETTSPLVDPSSEDHDIVLDPTPANPTNTSSADLSFLDNIPNDHDEEDEF
ncbi:hypothetical protein DICPUDRAFT_49561 [Dictyostelium purpureum]|uniref:Coatomer subunit beta' n=1 Tax=Dictyostelium purpureum TaxID=5786 RepID=F0ZU53_DICPU|nr:uncharacterized protein DICPUDRAFT_49561 [Dictyostelium purpureum]EGC32525.1 hypothetical protein DICPUDRAFT_49561 [Dictyostelium purpureum]|eukprot:XP_003290937.1 hypothetical protein DICPUDRAFT_49561 [Dictyostelium purpureum]